MKYVGFLIGLGCAACGTTPGPLPEPQPTGLGGVITGNGLTVRTELLSYSGRGTLDTPGEPRSLFLLGRSGAVTAAQADTIEVEVAGARATVGAEGAFVVGFSGAYRQQLDVVFRQGAIETTQRLTLDDDLTTVNAPVPDVCPGCRGHILSRKPSTSAEVTVALADLWQPAPPYLIFNRSAAERDDADVVRYADDIVAVGIPARTEDEICLFQQGPQASPLYCETSP
jgi:hypothetical protein